MSKDLYSAKYTPYRCAGKTVTSQLYHIYHSLVGGTVVITVKLIKQQESPNNMELKDGEHGLSGQDNEESVQAKISP